MKWTTKIKAALNETPLGSPIRVYRARFEEAAIDGYLLGIGPTCFALQLVDEGVRLNGFYCLRYADLTSAEIPAPYAAFIERVLRIRGQVVALTLPVDLSSLPNLIRTAGLNYTLVTLHQESVNPRACYIGKVLSVDEEELSIRSIGPGGEWDDGEDCFVMSEITRIDFGGAYEEALLLGASEG